MHEWRVGDLVKIKTRDWDAIVDGYSIGIITDVSQEEEGGQQLIFPYVAVYDLKSNQVDNVYPSNLEILSSTK